MKIILPLLFTVQFSFFSIAQQRTEKFEFVVPGPEYEAGFIHNFFFGKHWRDIWTTPVKIGFLNLNKFDGGLIPLKRGGGLQTASLRFISANGNQWKFRSINKDPSKVLPEELRESVVESILKDQISSANPYAPLVAAPLLEAVGILQAKPYLFIIPDSELLGEFRNEFGNMIGMIEIHPDENEENNTGFSGSDKVKGTYKLLRKLEEERDHKVDALEFLKARLMDIFMGDWDRHTDQWRWAKFESGDLNLWKPIPRDRDQVFSKYDGLGPSIAEYLIPQLNHFGFDYPNIEDITWNGRYLDRRFLSEINSYQWDSVTAFVKDNLTDSVIELSVKSLPDEIYPIASGELIGKLKSRRDNLTEISDEFFKLVNKIVNIYGSVKDDYVEIIRLNNDSTSVSLFRRDKQTGDKKGTHFYSKIFLNELTSEIRLHLLDGDDFVILKGNVDVSPMIRIVGYDGADELIDSSVVNGYLLSFLPIPDAENKTVFYDSGKKTKVVFSSGTVLVDDFYPEPEKDEERFEPGHRDWGHDFLFYPLPGYDSDNGFMINANFIFTSFDFRAFPYDYRLSFNAGYSTLPGSYNLGFKGEFYSVLKNARINLEAYKSELLLTKFYGFGNETDFSSSLESEGFYRLDQEVISVEPSIDLFLSDDIILSAGLSFSSFQSSIKNPELFENFLYDSYGVGSMKLSGLHSSVEYDSRDNVQNPLRGIYLRLYNSYYPELFENSESFNSLGIDLRTYLSGELVTDYTFAMRAGGKKLNGKFPFFMSAFLGGEDNLRGYSRERFAGDAYLFGQTELRLKIAEAKIILKGDLGVFGFIETGKVFATGINSDKWHPSYGGGIWASYLKREINFSVSAAYSAERLAFYLTSSMMF